MVTSRQRLSEVWLQLLCFSGRIPRLSLIQHSLYVGVVEKHPPPPLTGKQYGRMEPQYPQGGHCQNVLRPQGVFYTHDVVSREINLWKCFDLLMGSNLWYLAPSAGCFIARLPELTRLQIPTKHNPDV